MPDLANRLTHMPTPAGGVYFKLLLGDKSYVISRYGDNQWCASAVLRKQDGHGEIGQVNLFAGTPELVAQALVRLEQGQREAMRDA